MSKIVKEPIMGTPKKYTICFGLVLTLFSMMIYGCSCNARKPTPDPLAGWQGEYNPQPSDRIIEKDCEDYIHTLSPGEQKFVGPIFGYHNGTGERAVRIEIDIDGKDCWYHVLFYNKDNKRTKVVKYFFGRYVS